MTSKPTRAPAKKKQPAAVQTSESIAEKTRIYLESGKKIQSIEPGVSGQSTTPVKKQISLGNKQKES
jgi:predicted transcriptional regulator